MKAEEMKAESTEHSQEKFGNEGRERALERPRPSVGFCNLGKALHVCRQKGRRSGRRDLR